jgi:hypothetical protein
MSPPLLPHLSVLLFLLLSVSVLLLLLLFPARGPAG